MLDLDEVVQSSKASWTKIDFIPDNACIYNALSANNHLLWCAIQNDNKIKSSMPLSSIPGNIIPNTL